MTEVQASISESDILYSRVQDDSLDLFRGVHGPAGRACRKYLENPLSFMERVSQDENSQAIRELLAGIMRLHVVRSAEHDARVSYKLAHLARQNLRQLSVEFYKNREPNPAVLVETLQRVGISTPTIDEIIHYYRETPQRTWVDRSNDSPKGPGLPIV